MLALWKICERHEICSTPGQMQMNKKRVWFYRTENKIIFGNRRKKVKTFESEKSVCGKYPFFDGGLTYAAVCFQRLDARIK